MTLTGEENGNTNLDVLRTNPRPPLLDDDQRPTDPTTITSDMHGLMMQVDVDPHEFVDLSGPPHLPERLYEPFRETSETEQVTVDVDYEIPRREDLRTGDCPNI
jgi:hypothetical protein